MTTPAIQQQERLARRAKQANDRAAKLNPAPHAFTHQPMAPFVPKEAAHCRQRYFSRGDETRAVALDSNKTPGGWGRSSQYAEVNVFRWGDKDVAELSLRTGSDRIDCTATVMCTAVELREIAARLLDAAHDLDTLPARLLQWDAA